MAGINRSAAQLLATIVGNKKVGQYHQILISVGDLVSQCKPGNFVAISVGGPSSKMVLRRAFAISRTTTSPQFGGAIELIVAPHGSGCGAILRNRAATQRCGLGHAPDAFACSAATGSAGVTALALHHFISRGHVPAAAIAAHQRCDVSLRARLGLRPCCVCERGSQCRSRCPSQRIMHTSSPLCSSV